MKIYHLSSAPFTGGAARAAFRLHEGLLREKGIDSVWLDPGTGASGEAVQLLSPPTRPDSLHCRIRRNYWGSIVRRQFAPTTPPASNPIGWGSIDMLSSLPVPDVWNLHWVSWFLDWEIMLPWMAERAPIVWTLHDLNPLKGIWHYEPLPEEYTPKRMALEAKAVEMKRRALAKVPTDRLTFVGPSRWMVDACRKSPVTENFPTVHIPYGLDTEIFSPRDRTVLRKIYGIPENALVIGFIADNLNDPRKGMEALQQALLLLAKKYPGAHLVTVGNGALHCGGLKLTHLGPLHNDLLLSYFYSACDLFVCPSLQDNLPNTVLESLACGTPVVAFDTGGLPDMVRPDQTGYLVNPTGNKAALTDSLLEAAAHPATMTTLRVSARASANHDYQLKTQVSKYLSIYEKLK
jgi:glycosyltransferase involved in cell wall biosynthesis